MQRKYDFYKDRDYANIVPITAETFKEALLKAAEIFGVDTSRVHWSPNFEGLKKRDGSARREE